MNTKQKGNNFERDCSRMLSLWVTNGHRDDAIWRSASSGALTTVGKGRYLAHTGDFAATDGEAAWLFEHVIIEAKRGYNRYSMQDLLDVPEPGRAKNPVWEMVTKLEAACTDQSKYGLLLWKRDRRELLAFWRGNSYYDIYHRRTMHFYGLDDEKGWLGTNWNDFSSIVSADRLRSLLAPPGASSSPTPSNLAP